MEKYDKKTIIDNLEKYDYLAKRDDYIEISEWKNGEGWDIFINDKYIKLTLGELKAINYLTSTLEMEEDLL